MPQMSLLYPNLIKVSLLLSLETTNKDFLEK